MYNIQSAWMFGISLTKKKNKSVLINGVSVLTLFRLGFFGQSVTGGGGSSDPSSVSLEPIHNDHLRTKKPHTQF